MKKKLKKLIALFEEADAVTVDDSGYLTKFRHEVFYEIDTEKNPPEKVFGGIDILIWRDDDPEFIDPYVEETIFCEDETCRFEGNAFVIIDKDGDKVKVKFYETKELRA